MRLLLDTHVFLWAVTGSRRLNTAARQVIAAADEVYVSSASIWEITIKASIGRIDADPDELAAVIEPSGFIALPVSAMHAAGVRHLPPIHQDPFNRLLVAQALAEPLRLITADGQLSRYTDLVITV